MKNLILQPGVRQKIDRRVDKILSDLDNPEPPLRLEDVRVSNTHGNKLNPSSLHRTCKYVCDYGSVECSPNSSAWRNVKTQLR